MTPRRILLFAALLPLLSGCDLTDATGPVDSPAAAETLKPVQGSVDVDDVPQIPAALLGRWYLWQVDSVEVRDQAIELTFGDTGMLQGGDGCSGFMSNYTATSTSLRIDFTRAAINFGWDTTHQVKSVLDNLRRVRSWNTSGTDLLLSDSSGHVLLCYGRSKPKPVPTTIIGSIQGKDTSNPQIFGGQIVATTVSDSGVLLDLILPCKNLEVRLFALDSFQGTSAAIPTDPSRYPSRPERNDVPEKILVAGWDADPTDLHGQAHTPARIFVPWTLLQTYVSFVDGYGGAYTQIRPGWTLR